MDTLKLDQNVRDLTKAQRLPVDRDYGTTFTGVPSLLDQLRDAKHPGGGNGGPRANMANLPLAAEAVDLYTDIQATSHEFARYYTPRRQDTVEDAIRAWAAGARETQDAIDAAERITGYWVSQIRSLLDPPRVEQVSAVCPNCERRYQYHREAGETLRSAAIQIVKRDNNYPYAECGCCGTMWDHTRLYLLAAVMEEQTA